MKKLALLLTLVVGVVGFTPSRAAAQDPCWDCVSIPSPEGGDDVYCATVQSGVMYCDVVPTNVPGEYVCFPGGPSCPGGFDALVSSPDGEMFVTTGK